jgi:tRNA(Leu) C34 or U34 (ribose-2'-O)-methylase TrmL
MSKILQVNQVKRGMGVAPAIMLHNPKFARNLGACLRACAAFDVPQIWFSGDRLTLDPTRQQRLPREERMKGYANVSVFQTDRMFDAFASDVVPVAVELKPGAVQLHEFEITPNMVFLFGPEDGSLERVHLRHCHHVVVIPTRHCLNLATAVTTVLWHRQYCLHRSGVSPIPHQDDLLSQDRACLREFVDEEDEASIG